MKKRLPPDQAPLVRIVFDLTLYQECFLCELGCFYICTRERGSGRKRYRLTFPLGTRRQPLPEVLAGQLHTHDAWLILPNGRILTETPLSAQETLLHFPSGLTFSDAILTLSRCWKNRGMRR